MAYKPSSKRKASDEQVEPNITPIMNLMVVLIPVLLSMAEFIKLALMEYMPPPVEEVAANDSEGDGGGDSGAGAAKLDLLLNISEEGFQVSMFGDTQGENFITVPRIPKLINGQPLIDPATGIGLMEYNYSGLHDTLVWIRREKIGPPVDVQDVVNPETGASERREVFRYEDSQTIKIAGKGDMPWQVVVHVLDAIRDFEDPSDEIGPNGTPLMLRKPLFSSPQLGQIQ